MVVRYLHNFSSRFESATVLRVKLVEQFQELVPDNLSFNIGYYEGRKSLKIWLMSKEDFTTMYVKCPKGEITLWCDARSDKGSDTCTGSRKKHVRKMERLLLREKMKYMTCFAAKRKT